MGSEMCHNNRDKHKEIEFIQMWSIKLQVDSEMYTLVIFVQC